MDISTRVRMARLRAGMTQLALADLVGVTRTAVTNWEIASRPNPCAAHMAAIAVVTDVQFEWLATGRGAMQPSVFGADNVLSFGETTKNAQERQLLRDFRSVPDDMRGVVLTFLHEQVMASVAG